MKSIVGTIMVLAVFGFAMASSTLAQGGVVEASAAAGTDTSENVVPINPEPLPPTPLGASTDEQGVDVLDTLVDSMMEEPTYEVRFQPGTPASSSKVLVIPSTEIKTEEVVAITRDMQVMSHIFDKIFKGPRLIEGVFVDYGDFFGRGSRATQAIYLQGFGTLFVMEVDFPFTPPAESKEKPKDTKEADSVWNQAKREIFSPKATVVGVKDQGEKYDAEKVEELKSRLIKALKHAANIRNLKSDEWIILTVIGRGRSYGGGYGVGGYGGGSYGGGGYGVGAYGGYGGAVNVKRSYSSAGRGRYTTTRIVPGGVSVPSSTVLTIRAKKSDVDTFAKGDLDYDEFREKVQVLTYSSLGQKLERRLHITRQRLPGESTPESTAPEPTKDAQF